MLIKHSVLRRIFSEDIDLQFRRWNRPTVREGSSLRTRDGMLSIVSVDHVTTSELTAHDAHRAGYATKALLLEDLRRQRKAPLYRVEIAPAGPDPLIALRNTSELTTHDVQTIRAQLNRYDDRSTDGPWCATYLTLVGENPRVRAEDLADSLGVTKPFFKSRIRKLKAMGLTISHSPGHELSPRGESYLRNQN